MNTKGFGILPSNPTGWSLVIPNVQRLASFPIIEKAPPVNSELGKNVRWFSIHQFYP